MCMESHVVPASTPEGQLIRRTRELAVPKPSIRTAAKRIGMSAEQWGYVERGYYPGRGDRGGKPFSPPAATLARMARSLGISPDRLETEGQRPDAAEMLRGDAPRTAPARDSRSFIPHEVPLGDGEIARLVLPQDMTADEADRLCGVIRSLAFG